ncbi:MAG: hypothetical protein RJR34_13115 [Candidatus Methanoculleus thermohydrogenotrophicum]|nr:hypothetical protein [Candidatus Methanoculleus thermohydrogenotrophicum]
MSTSTEGGGGDPAGAIADIVQSEEVRWDRDDLQPQLKYGSVGPLRNH